MEGEKRYGVLATTKYLVEIFETRQEAETFINIEGTQVMDEGTTFEVVEYTGPELAIKDGGD